MIQSPFRHHLISTHYSTCVSVCVSVCVQVSVYVLKSKPKVLLGIISMQINLASYHYYITFNNSLDKC